MSRSTATTAMNDAAQTRHVLWENPEADHRAELGKLDGIVKTAAKVRARAGRVRQRANELERDVAPLVNAEREGTLEAERASKELNKLEDAVRSL